MNEEFVVYCPRCEEYVRDDPHESRAPEGCLAIDCPVGDPDLYYGDDDPEELNFDE